MHDGGGSGQQHHPGGGSTDPKVLVATTLAALVLAGSAYIWKSGTNPMLRGAGGRKPTGLLRNSNDTDSNGILVPDDAGSFPPRRDNTRKGAGSLEANDPQSSSIATGESTVKRKGSQAKLERDVAGSSEPRHDPVGGTTQRQQEAGIDPTTNGSLGRALRTKERRRRGKDPTKELLKTGKLGKATTLTLVGRAGVDVPSHGPSQHDFSPPSSSHSRVSSETHGQSSTPRPQRQPSKSPSGTNRRHLSSLEYTSTSVQTSRHQNRSHSRSQSRSRPGSSSEVVGPHIDSASSLSGHPPSQPPQLYPVDSANNSTSNLDAASTTSSTSSSNATDRTAFSLNSASTAPSSLTSPTSQSRTDPDRLNDSDGTPKAEGVPPGVVAFNRPPAVSQNPWNWDGAAELNSLRANHTASASGSTKPPRIQSKDASGSSASSEVLSGNVAPLLYASIASTNGKSASSSTPSKSGDIEGIASPVPASRHLLEEEEEKDEERLDEAEEILFPSLNNPESTSGSPWLTGANSASSSGSRPHSRASSSSATSSKGKPKHSRTVSALAPLSMRNSTPPIASGSGQGGGHRRVPTPRDVSLGRPGTPNSLLSPSHPPPSPSSPYYTQAFLNSGNTVTVSAQTQLASLRGALEAARLREEKSKHELEKATRESDALRWENTAWRRREGELQSQIQQMAHQMQSYANYVASMNQHSQFSQAQGNLIPSSVPVSVSPSQAPDIGAQPPPNSNSTSAEVTEPLNEPSEKLDSINSNEQFGLNSETDVPSSGESPPSVPSSNNVPPAPNADDATPIADPAHTTAVGEGNAPTSPVPSSQPTLLAFAPHPINTYPVPFSHPPYLHQPASPHPQSPVGMHLPFGFPHLTRMNQHQPAPHSPQTHPSFSPFPFAHPGMVPMHPHPHSYTAQSPSSAGFTNGNFPPMTSPGHPTMGIGMMSPGGMSPAHPSPWMNGIGSANGYGRSTAGKLGGLDNMSPDLASNPSSPLPSFFSQERGRSGRGKGRGASGGGEEEGERMGGQEDDDSVPDRDSDGSGGEKDEEEGSFNVLLADAILKRPSSIRMGSGLSKRSTSNLGRDKGGAVSLAGSVSVNGVWPGLWAYGGMANESSPQSLDEGENADSRQGKTSQGDHEEEEEQREFTFPSLSELGNVAREKRVGTPALIEGSGSAASGLEGSVASSVLKNESESSSLSSDSVSKSDQ